MIMSGDKRESVRSVADRIGIAESDIYAELKPQDKQRLVGELREQKGVVAMVSTLGSVLYAGAGNSISLTRQSAASERLFMLG
jgi:soluble P-type ATPase